MHSIILLLTRLVVYENGPVGLNPGDNVGWRDKVADGLEGLAEGEGKGVCDGHFAGG